VTVTAAGGTSAPVTADSFTYATGCAFIAPSGYDERRIGGSQNPKFSIGTSRAFSHSALKS
jgi:hypothetical protein